MSFIEFCADNFQTESDSFNTLNLSASASEFFGVKGSATGGISVNITVGSDIAIAATLKATIGISRLAAFNKKSYISVVSTKVCANFCENSVVSMRAATMRAQESNAILDAGVDRTLLAGNDLHLDQARHEVAAFKQEMKTLVRESYNNKKSMACNMKRTEMGITSILSNKTLQAASAERGHVLNTSTMAATTDLVAIVEKRVDLTIY